MCWALKAHYAQFALNSKFCAQHTSRSRLQCWRGRPHLLSASPLPPPRRVLISTMINTKILGRQRCCCCCSFLPEVFRIDRAGSVGLCSFIHAKSYTTSISVCRFVRSWWVTAVSLLQLQQIWRYRDREQNSLLFSLFLLYVTLRAHTLQTWRQ